jgi:hypothetical protein
VNRFAICFGALSALPQEQRQRFWVMGLLVVRGAWWCVFLAKTVDAFLFMDA